MGSVNLITGGASGLGRATVDRLIQKGGRVILCDLPSSKGHQVAKDIGEDKCVFCPVDVTKEQDVQNAVALTKSKFGRLNNVVNCAGIALALKVYDFKNKTPHSLELFSNIININTIGTFNVVRLAVGLMGENVPDREGQRGVVINTASVAGYDGTNVLAAYAASKGAVIGMTLPLARDLSSQGIRVCTIAPGMFLTPIVDQVPQDIKHMLAMTVPFPKRFGDPPEFAHLVQTIIDNPMLNGEVIRLDGAVRLQD